MSDYRSGNYLKYATRNPVVRWLIGWFLRELREVVERISPRRILDAGCGEGFVVRYLLDAFGDIRIEGLDVNEAALERARAMNPGVRFHRGNVLDLPFEDDSFDLVIAAEVLEHLSEPERAVAEFGRVSSKYCLITVPHEPFFQVGNFLRGKNLSRWGNDPDHIQRWTLGQFLSFLRPHLEIIEVRRPFPWIMVLGGV